jgi:hypothetical protein
MYILYHKYLAIQPPKNVSKRKTKSSWLFQRLFYVVYDIDFRGVVSNFKLHTLETIICFKFRTNESFGGGKNTKRGRKPPQLIARSHKNSFQPMKLHYRMLQNNKKLGCGSQKKRNKIFNHKTCV